MEQAAPSSPLEHVRARIATAAKISRRQAKEVTLVAISKTKPAEAILDLISQGQRVFGENRVQEAQEKWPAIRAVHPDVELHLVGQLQSNKAENAVALFDCIHSLDRSSLIVALAAAQAKLGKRVPCFIQVNIGNEDQKGGCAVSDLPDLLGKAQAMDIEVIGLMCVPPAGIEPAPFFALLDKLANDSGLERLSMGMSDDLETAVQLGASHVRVGAALFGSR
ncbi:alanine racemase [Novosphingobium sp. AAP83]|uniref:YggS family pyridoxal phosphate-dependent enzyme n=1 Tax=Novosphingobium sp. AAP83 TaxID=1523425 RepID=UPI0006B9E2A0|nr:YggS family pyridoxal phosphate-dependent enzyme [Novosphingobium sp. AAP83]KPF93940.1 alanine racemase [Novosphingobium sp. AAP83]